MGNKRKGCYEMSATIKGEFGKRFRAARDAKKLSRAALGLRLGISPKTIQSWEMGRTFIENLSLIPSIESELNISVSDLICKATTGDSVAAEAPAAYGGKRKSGRLNPGPVAVSFEICSEETARKLSESRLAELYVAVPRIKPTSALKPVSEISGKDIVDHVLIPGEWVPRGGVLVAYRMGDSGMLPMIPLDATVIVDRRPLDTVKGIGKVLAFNVTGKGLRIRRLQKEHGSGKFFGTTTLEGARGKFPFRPESGDEIVGRVVGIMALPD